MNTYDYAQGARDLVRAAIIEDRAALAAALRAAADPAKLARYVADEAARIYCEPVFHFMGPTPEAYQRALADYDAETVAA